MQIGTFDNGSLQTDKPNIVVTMPRRAEGKRSVDVIAKEDIICHGKNETIITNP